MALSLLFLVLFYLLIFAVGMWAGRRNRQDRTPEGLLLAGRRVPIFIGVCTMTATWVGGGYINGTAEAVYDSHRGIAWAQAPWGYALSLILGGLLFARRMRRLGLTTLLDPFEMRYGKRVTAVLFLPAVTGEVFWSAAILVALGTTFSTILELDPTVSILLSAAIAVAYTLVGGLWSVAWTDVVQLLCILFGLLIAIPFAVAGAGGAQRVCAEYMAQMPPLPTGAERWLWMDTALLLVLGGIPWQVYFQRVLASKDESAAVRLSVIAGIGCLLMAVPAAAIGAVGAVADWPTPPGSPTAEPALVLPYVLKYLTPPLIATMGLGAVAAAVMSSVDSSILSASSMFVWNVYRPLIRPRAGDREIRLVLRGALLAVGTLATLLALQARSVYDLWYLCSDLVYVILFPQLVTALFDRRANPTGAIAGAVVGLILRLGGGEPMFAIPTFLPYPMQTPDGCLFPFRTFAMLSGLVTICVVSRVADRMNR